MKKMNKKITALMLTLALCSSMPLVVSAAPETAVESVTETETSISQSIQQQSAENSETSNYRFSENTVGNADLVASEEVVADNGQFQFIAVTTRDGDIFYVIIDRLKAENNVYFLNEVDTYDLKKLMGEESNQSDNTSTGTVQSNNTSSAKIEETSIVKEKSSNNGLDMNMLMIGGIAVLAIIVGIIFFIMKKGGKKKQPIPLDDDFEYEEEINEDEENKT